MHYQEQLYQSLHQRKRPEDVIELILKVLENQLTLQEKQALEKAAQGSLSRNSWAYTSMSQEFSMPVGAERQIKKAVEIFGLEPNSSIDYSNAHDISKFIKDISLSIHKTPGQNHFMRDRLNKLEREVKGVDISKRKYNKKWRLIQRIERKLEVLTTEIKKNELQQVAKNGLARDIGKGDFFTNPNSACFIAYYTSRLNLRSEFTIHGQVRAFDTICKLLFKRCKDAYLTMPSGSYNEGVSWWAIAHVYPSQQVLSKLTEQQKGVLLGKWTSILEEIALKLKELWSANTMNRKSMVVRRGNDSSTWNATAGAWNKARDHWMHLIYALGAEHILDDICFGKVLRLVAGDLAAWHYSSGGQLDPNTKVWSELPVPWAVFSGKRTCTKAMVIKACKTAGVDPERSGWIAPRTHGVVAFRTTPELVHGIAISNPFLAASLKQGKFFSGKKTTKTFFWNN